MQNDKTYFAILSRPDSTFKKVYPKTITKCNYDGVEMFAHQQKIGEWIVTECSTGLPIATSKFSKIDAMQQARNEINRRGRFNVMSQIDLASQALRYVTIYEDFEND
jgi:hypothetical protein